MNRISILLVGAALVGCQEYTFDEDKDSPEISNVPPTVYPPVPTPPPTVPPTVPVAEAPVYANTSGELFEVEPDTGLRTSIGIFRDSLTGAPVEGFFDIAIDNQGGVYGGTDDGIFRIDPETAEVEKLCDTADREWGSFTRPLGMAFTPDDRLLLAGETKISHLNLGSCQEINVVANTGYATSGDIVNLPDGYVYWTVEETDHEDKLIRIDPADWSLSYVGLIGFGKLYGIGYADGQLFGFSRYGDTVAIAVNEPLQGGYIPTVALRNDEGFSWYGATTNPVAWDAE